MTKKTTYSNRMHKIGNNTIINRLFPGTHEFYCCYMDEVNERVIIKYKKKEPKYDITNEDILLRIQNLQFEKIRINQEISALTKQLKNKT